MARGKSPGKRKPNSAKKTPGKEKTGVHSSAEKFSPRRSSRLSGKSESEDGDIAYVRSVLGKKAKARKDVAIDASSVVSESATSTDMARSYGKYQKLKDTPDHLYGLDGRFVASGSDEDEDVDVGELSDETFNNQHFLRKKLGRLVLNYWKSAFCGFLLVLFTGISTAFLVQVYTPTEPPKNPDVDQSSEVLRKIEEKVERLSSILQVLANNSDTSLANKSLLSEKTVQDIVQAALHRYNADKVGMADFALESSGAQIHDHYHSNTYDVGAARVVVFGVPLWLDVKPPRVIIQPDNSPGNCWAFKGEQGYVVIKLSKMLIPTAFSLEHIPKLLSPTGDGRIPSAPKAFSVWAWHDPEGKERVQLGKYIFDSEADFLQTFKVQSVQNSNAVKYIELRILSNHGNPEYTCVYRFRVHGNPQQS